jgi:outer membrane protein
MLEKKLAIFLVLMMGAFTTLSTAAADTKIAFVEVSSVLQNAPQVKKVKDSIKKEFSPRDNALVSQQKQIKKLQQKLQRDGSIMSEEESRRLELDILSRSRKLKNAQSEFQEDLALRQNEELNKLRKVIAEVIIEVAKQEGIELVLESGVVWASDEINITKKVLDKLSK